MDPVAGSVVDDDGPKSPLVGDKAGEGARPRQSLALRLSAGQLFDFRFLRSASVVAGLQRIFGFALFARRPFRFLTFVFAECSCIGHEILRF